MFNADVTCIRGDYDHGESCPDHAEDPRGEGARRALAWGGATGPGFMKAGKLQNVAQHLRILRIFV